VLALVNIVNWADRQVVPVLFSPISRELNLTDTELGVIGGMAFSLVYAMSAFMFGHFADRWIRRSLIAIGLVVWSLATMASGLADSFWTLFAARFFTGIGEASLYPCAMSLIAERYPAATRGRALGVFGAATAIGGGLGLGLGGYLAELVGWRQVFFIYGGVGFLLLPAVLAVSEAPRAQPEAKDSSLNVLKEVLGDGGLQRMWAAGAIMIAGLIGYAAWMPSFVERVHGFSESDAGMIAGAGILFGGVFGSMLGGWIADIRGRIRSAGELDVAMASAALTAPLIVIGLFATWMPLVVTAALIVPVTAFAFFPSLQMTMMRVVPPNRFGMAYACQVLFFGGIGAAAGPFMIGAASDAFGDLRQAMLLSAITSAVAFFLIWWTASFLRSRMTAERDSERSAENATQTESDGVSRPASA
jgi:predicted MFS family arabinose efflux permease